MSKRLHDMIVSRDYFSKMKDHRQTMIKKYNDLTEKYKDYYDGRNRKSYISLLEYRQKCNNNPVCEKWEIVVSDFVTYMWEENVNVDKSIYKNSLDKTINIIISEIEELWEISAYLNSTIGIKTDSFSESKTNVVDITRLDGRAKSPKRVTHQPNVLLKNRVEPAPTDAAETKFSPFDLTNKTVEPITKNSITTIFKNLVTTENPVKTILKTLAPIVVTGVLSAWAMWYYNRRQQNGMDGGGKEEDDEIENAYKALIEENVNDVKKFIKEEVSDEQKKQIINEVKKNVSTEDFEEFKLKDGETIFGKMFDGGKRKRSTKRSTKKNKKNKKSNRKRRA